MNAKLTLTLDKARIAEIKKHAKEAGQSVSELADKLFSQSMEKTDKQPVVASEIVSSIRGSFAERTQTPRKKTAPKTAPKAKEE